MSGLGGYNVVVVSSADHSKAVMNALGNLFDSKLGTDFDFFWEGRSLRVHRIILELFLAPEVVRPVGNEQHVPQVKQEIPDDDCSNKGVLYYLLEFLYKGEVHIPEEQLEELLRVAKALNFNMLVDAIDQTCYFNNGEIFKNSSKIKTEIATSCYDDLSLSAGESEEETVKPCYVGHEACIEFRKNPGEALLPSDSQEDSRSPKSNPRTKHSHSRLLCKSESTNSKPFTKAGRKRALLVVEPPLTERELGTFWHDSIPGGAKLIKIEAEEVDDSSRESCSSQTEGRNASSRKNRNKYKCVLCNLESPNKVEYCKHVCSVHELSLRDEFGENYKCPECDFSSLWLSNIRGHMLSKHTKEKRYACDYCSYAVTKKFLLKHHLNTVHNLGVCRFVCETCDKHCSSLSTLQAHTLSHTQERPFKCEHCPFAANLKHGLIKHVRKLHSFGGTKGLDSHSKEKPYACQHCNYSATEEAMLMRHLNIVHNLGDCRFKCETCGKNCKDRFQLQCHIRTHTQERPFKCELCTFCANTKVSLERHVLRMHKKI